jgi:hypothetical protein
MMLRLQPAHILMNLGVSSGLSHRTPAVAAQFRDDTGSNNYIQDKMSGSMVMDCGTCKLVRVE